jgi:hypothetical protein
MGLHQVNKIYMRECQRIEREVGQKAYLQR